jgi:hypothetical protein
MAVPMNSAETAPSYLIMQTNVSPIALFRKEKQPAVIARSIAINRVCGRKFVR